LKEDQFKDEFDFEYGGELTDQMIEQMFLVFKARALKQASKKDGVNQIRILYDFLDDI
jgi:hypothetical protein